MTAFSAVNIRSLGLTDYSETFEEMKNFTKLRTSGTADEIWFTEHRFRVKISLKDLFGLKCMFY